MRSNLPRNRPTVVDARERKRLGSLPVLSSLGAIIVVLTLILPTASAGSIAPRAVTTFTAPYSGSVTAVPPSFGGATLLIGCAWSNVSSPASLSLTTGKGAGAFSVAALSCANSTSGNQATGLSGFMLAFPLNISKGGHLQVQLTLKATAHWTMSLGTCAPNAAYLNSCDQSSDRLVLLQSKLHNIGSGRNVSSSPLVVAFNNFTIIDTTCTSGVSSCTRVVNGLAAGSFTFSGAFSLFANASLRHSQSYELDTYVLAELVSYIGTFPGVIAHAKSTMSMSLSYAVTQINQS